MHACNAYPYERQLTFEVHNNQHMNAHMHMCMCTSGYSVHVQCATMHACSHACMLAWMSACMHECLHAWVLALALHAHILVH
mmetsp:Transcript_1620/g.4371  ORF Transcript_1620/g.4371 Transcript_1620/m.4371 type:complete len:82 (-) Transcript_1620:1432-1677(-)